MNTYKITYINNENTFTVFVQASSMNEAMTAIDMNNVNKITIEIW